MKLSKLLALASVTTVFLCGASALAAEWVYPGAMCVKHGTGTASVSDSGGVRSAHSTDNLQLICPIVRPNTTSSIISASMRVHDGHDDEAVTTWLVCRDDNGTSNFQEDDLSGVDQVDTYISLGWSALGDYNDGACFFEVTLPDTDTADSWTIVYAAEF